MSDAEQKHMLFVQPTLEEQNAVVERWTRVMARIGVKPVSAPGLGRVCFKPTALNVQFDILEIVEGICDFTDRITKDSDGGVR